MGIGDSSCHEREIGFKNAAYFGMYERYRFEN
jgi:hypothetical protein